MSHESRQKLYRISHQIFVYFAKNRNEKSFIITGIVLSVGLNSVTKLN